MALMVTGPGTPSAVTPIWRCMARQVTGPSRPSAGEPTVCCTARISAEGLDTMPSTGVPMTFCHRLVVAFPHTPSTAICDVFIAGLTAVSCRDRWHGGSLLHRLLSTTQGHPRLHPRDEIRARARGREVFPVVGLGELLPR